MESAEVPAAQLRARITIFPRRWWRWSGRSGLLLVACAIAVGLPFRWFFAVGML